MAQKRKIILASASPRRRELLTEAGIGIDIIPANIDESALPAELPRDHVGRLAREKAMHIASQHADRLVIGADTIIVFHDQMLGKPRDMEHAYEMLQTLCGTSHEVLTGVAICRTGESPLCENWVCSTSVTFKPLTLEEIKEYCALINPLDKAGAYAIQEYAYMILEELSGLHSNVIGLPIEQVTEKLSQLS